jgi:hypothetical protein
MNNKDLISRSNLYNMESLLMSDIVLKDPTARYILEQVLYDIEHVPAEDAVPVMHGQWIAVEDREYLGVRCSSCQKWFNEKTNYCPHCGSDMR